MPLSESEQLELKPFESIACPGLFYAVSAQDGVIARIRTPGGQISSEQGRVLANFAEQVGDGWLQVTNRANLQIRAVAGEISAAALSQLQACRLAASAKIDHLRNVMASPTAGIDPQAVYDTRPLIQAFDCYISEHPELASLSAKFSVGIDGGEAVSVRDRPNDIKLVAVKQAEEAYFRLYLNIEKGADYDTGILLHPQDCVRAVNAVAQVYLAQVHFVQDNRPVKKKPRLRELIQQFGIEPYLEAVRLNCSLNHQFASKQRSQFQPQPLTRSYRYIGAHPQRQSGYSYLGVALPLGWLKATQLRALADLADDYGSSELRLTPWQNLLLSDVATSQIGLLQKQIIAIGLSISVNHPYTGLVACTGNTGCAASATNTKQDAMQLAAELEQLALDNPVNIHVTGCSKSCAQHHGSDITLLGTVIERNGELVEAYHVYVGAEPLPPGQLLYDAVASTQVSTVIKQMLAAYQSHRSNAESFNQFIRRHHLQELQNLFRLE